MSERIATSLTNCDMEPIHIPGSIQPYGFMIIADSNGRIVGHAGYQGDSSALQNSSLVDHIGYDFARALDSDLPKTGFKVLGDIEWKGQVHDVIAFRSGPYTVLELTEADSAPRSHSYSLAALENIGSRLERSISLRDLANQTAKIFQELTGYGKVMVYRFIDDEAGVVIGEAIANDSASFLNHHFPGTDIPRQARALYLRNRVRVIADVNYKPQQIVSLREDLTSIDLSDSTLRSVSPVHIQYLKNMGVEASASMSIVKDGILWGLVTCHHQEPRVLSLATRLACQTIATAVAGQIKMLDEGELNRQRVRLRSREDLIVNRLGPDDNLREFLGPSAKDLMQLLGADGFAAIQGQEVFSSGTCPSPEMIRAIADHAQHSGSTKPYVTSQLSAEMPAAEPFKEVV